MGYRVVTIDIADKKEEGTRLFLTSRVGEQKDLLPDDLKEEFPGLTYSSEFESTEVEARIVVGF